MSVDYDPLHPFANYTRQHTHITEVSGSIEEVGGQDCGDDVEPPHNDKGHTLVETR